MSFEKIEIMKMRREYLEEYLNEIRSVMTGRNASIKSIIADENGKIIDEKLERLISIIVDEYYRLDSGWINELLAIDCISDEEAEKQLAANQIKVEMYHCFFYCALQGIVKVSLYEEIFKAVENFSDIVEILTLTGRDFQSTDEKELIWFDFWDLNLCRGFFDATRFGCVMLMDKHFATTYTPEQIAFCKTHFKDTDIPYKLDHLQEEFDKHMKTAYINEDAIEWKKKVSDPKKFINSYIRFREKYLEFMRSDCTKGDFIDLDIPKLIDDYLNDYLLSVISSDEESALAFDGLERLIKTIKRRRNK